MIRIKSKNLTIPQNRYFKTEKDADKYIQWLNQHGCIMWWEKSEVEDIDDIDTAKPEKRAERDINNLYSALKMEWQENRDWMDQRFFNKLQIIRGDSIEIGILNTWFPGDIDLYEYHEDIPDYITEMTRDIQQSDLICYPVTIIELANPLIENDVDPRYDYLHYPTTGILNHLYRDFNPLLLHLQNFYEYIIIIKVSKSDEDQKKIFSLLGFVDISERLDYTSFPIDCYDEYTFMVFYKTQLGRLYIDLAMDITASIYEGE